MSCIEDFVTGMGASYEFRPTRPQICTGMANRWNDVALAPMRAAKLETRNNSAGPRSLDRCGKACRIRHSARRGAQATDPHLMWVINLGITWGAPYVRLCSSGTAVETSEERLCSKAIAFHTLPVWFGRIFFMISHYSGRNILHICERGSSTLLVLRRAETWRVGDFWRSRWPGKVL
jgi:hypothetical protein